ncbi:hypothetical protein ACCO45_009505 [Purpureocillium lilacinum]|uniref:Uncharacterized protein n=1 Tax=Purpureocillium lilacinum TaxID=33203 RepID=A0ACC4DK24_PURLI
MAKVDEFHIQARRGPGCGSGQARTYHARHTRRRATYAHA